MTSLSMILNAGRPGFSLARDDFSQKKQQFRRSQLMLMGGYRVSNNSSCPLPIISSSGSHSPCHVFGSQSNWRNSSIFPCSGGGHGGGRRNFKVLGGGGHNEEDKSQPSQTFLRTIRMVQDLMNFIVYAGIGVQAFSFYWYYDERKRLEAKALKLHKEVEASVELFFAFTKATLEGKRLDAEKDRKALELHEKLEATVKKLLAESNPRLKSTRSEAGERAKALKLDEKAEPTVEKLLVDQMQGLKSNKSEAGEKAEPTVDKLLADQMLGSKRTWSEAKEKAEALKLHEKVETTVEKLLAWGQKGY